MLKTMDTMFVLIDWLKLSRLAKGLQKLTSKCSFNLAQVRGVLGVGNNYVFKRNLKSVKIP